MKIYGNVWEFLMNNWAQIKRYVWYKDKELMGPKINLGARVKQKETLVIVVSPKKEFTEKDWILKNGK